MLILILKVLFLFLGIISTLDNFETLLIPEIRIHPFKFLVQAVGITGFIYLQFLM